MRNKFTLALTPREFYWLIAPIVVVRFPLIKWMLE